jgi:hypothetical protein
MYLMMGCCTISLFILHDIIGDMVLYESHSVIHGRPFPLKGRFYANIFIHFEPTGHSLRHNANIEREDPTAMYRRALKNKHGGHENAEHEGLPPYILEDSEEGRLWHQNHPDNKRVSSCRNQVIYSFIYYCIVNSHIADPMILLCWLYFFVLFVVCSRCGYFLHWFNNPSA